MTENQQSQFQFDFDELMNDDNDNISNDIKYLWQKHAFNVAKACL